MKGGRGWERAMTACKNICWYVLLVLLEYLIWPAIVVEFYPEIHLLSLFVIKAEACFLVLLLNKLPELSRDLMGAFRNEACCVKTD